MSCREYGNAYDSARSWVASDEEMEKRGEVNVSDDAYTLDVASKACKENASRPMSINEVDSWRTNIPMPGGSGTWHGRLSPSLQ